MVGHLFQGRYKAILCEKDDAIEGKLVYFEDESFLDNYEEGVVKRADDLSYKRIEFEKDFFEAVRDGYFEIEHR